jgi:NADPH:quinone reductase-like Zn-dependent oxidoreductase
MKAAIFNAYGGVDVLTIADRPRPRLTPGQILVRVRAAAVNPKDTFVRKGRFRRFTGRRFPQGTGYDFAGEVFEVAAGVGQFEVGDEVYGLFDGWHGGTCAEYVAVQSHQLALKPSTLSFCEAAALPLVSLTALQALRDLAHISAGHQVCINGASGGVGSIAVQLANIFRSTVTAISRIENHPFLRQLGADHCIDYRQTNIGHRPTFDIFFDVFGNRPFKSVRPDLRPKGVWVSTVIRPHVFLSVFLTRMPGGQKAKLVRVKASGRDLVRVRNWVEEGQLRPIVHQVFPLDQIAAAHRQQETKHTRGKIVIALE